MNKHDELYSVGLKDSNHDEINMSMHKEGQRVEIVAMVVIIVLTVGVCGVIFFA